MNRVTMINLAGRAMYVEDDGVEAIEAWMESARETLEADPDRDELLADFEEAIANRCAAMAPADGEVVTAAHVTEVLEALGPVEPAYALGPTEEAIDGDAEPEASGGVTSRRARRRERRRQRRQRRLYRLTGEDEAMVAGVCAGLASYLNVDVTVVRLAAVLFALASLGAAVLVYAALALIVPAADSPDERLAARGYGDSAREVMSRAREQTRPALSSVGAGLRAAGELISGIVYWSLVVAVWAVLIGWTVAVVWVFADPHELSTAFEDGTSTWLIALWVSSAFWLAAGTLIVLAALARRLAAPSRNQMLGVAAAVVGVVMMTSAAVTLVTIPMATSPQMRALLDGEGTIEAFGETWCLTPEYGWEEWPGHCDDRSSSVVPSRVIPPWGGVRLRW